MAEKIELKHMGRKDIIERIIFSIVIAVLIFATGSYLPAIPVFLLVPIFAGFIVTFLFEDRKLSSIVAISLCGLLSVIFSIPPKLTPGITPDTITINLIADRQADMLRFSPPLLAGLLGGTLGWGLAAIIKEKEKLKKWVVWALFALLCINFVGISMDLNPSSVQKASKEPADGKFNNYNSLNLKTFYLMKKGLGFYPAYAHAFAQKADTPGQYPGDTWHWRSPTIFYIWSWILPADGFYILYLYLIACIICLYFIMDIARFYVDSPFHLLAPVMVIPLFAYGITGFWFTFPEYWGLFAFIMGVWGIHRKNPVVSIIGLCLAPLIRSLFFISWLGLIIPAFFTKKKADVLYLLLPGIIFPVDFLIHYRTIMSMEGVQVPPLGEWFKGSLEHFVYTLNFSFPLVSRAEFILPFMFILFIFTCVILRKNYTGRIILGCTILPMVIFLIMGTTTFRNYWGIVYLPFFLLAISLIPYKLKDKLPEIFPEGR